MKQKLIDYCNEHWSLEQNEIDFLELWRCPLSMVDCPAHTHLKELIEDFLFENDLDEDWFYDNFTDIDDVFYELELNY